MSAGIVVAVDGSAASDDALAVATALAREEGRALTGVFVIDAGWADFIGNDWQSSMGARQGFLDYVLADQEKHAAAARLQFEAAAADLPDRRFEILVGDPAASLVSRMASDDTTALVLGRETYAVCGRPSIKRLVQTVMAKVRQPVTVV